MPYLLGDIHSALNPGKCYGHKGAEVVVIRQTDGIAIVKLKDGSDRIGFSVLTTEITDEPITPNAAPADPEPVEPKKTAAVRRSRRPEPNDRPGAAAKPEQGALF